MTPAACPACRRRLAADAAWCSACLYVVDPDWRPAVRPDAESFAPPVPAMPPVRGWVPRQRSPWTRPIRLPGVWGGAVLLVVGAIALVGGIAFVFALTDAMFNSG